MNYIPRILPSQEIGGKKPPEIHTKNMTLFQEFLQFPRNWRKKHTPSWSFFRDISLHQWPTCQMMDSKLLIWAPYILYKTGLLGFWQWAEAELNCLENLFARAIGSNYYLALAFQGMLHITVNQNQKLDMKTDWHEIQLDPQKLSLEADSLSKREYAPRNHQHTATKNGVRL